MLALQYTHRLPADYDMRLIRKRARERGPLWDATPDLVFKAFVASEKDHHGATANAYASIYLWRRTQAATELLLGSRFQYVVDSFGRPRVETWLPLDLRIGKARRARSVQREEQQVAPSADRTALLEAERDGNRRRVARPDTVAAWSVLDPTHWKLVRFVLSDSPPVPEEGRLSYEVLHLAAPGLEERG